MRSIVPRINWTAHFGWSSWQKLRYRVTLFRLEERPISDASMKTATIPLIRDYMPELDSIRGIAVLMVLFLHGMARPLDTGLSVPGEWLVSISRHGGVGVNLFFVLSGFLITGILLDSKSRSDYYRRFYTRRARRIVPALCATLLLLFVGGWIHWRFALVSILFLANSAPLLGVPLQYGPLWSLAVEEHFYVLWPTLVRKLTSRRQLILLVSIIVLSPIVRAMAFVPLQGVASGNPLYTWFNLDGLAWGAMMAIWLRRPSFRRVHLSGVALPLLVIGVAAYVWLMTRPQASAVFTQSACALGSAGFLSCMLLAGTSRWKVLVDRPTLKFLGFISYGLYLIHVFAFRLTEILLSHLFPILVAAGKPTVAMLLRFAVGSGLAITLAFLSRRSLEERFLRRARGVESVHLVAEGSRATASVLREVG